MKKNYSPYRSNKRQRHMKKWIPDSIYCDRCKFWHDLTNKVKHSKKLCELSPWCDDNCEECKEPISYCSFLKHTVCGDFVFDDRCKICGIKHDTPKANKYILMEIAEDKLKTCIERSGNGDD